MYEVGDEDEEPGSESPILPAERNDKTLILIRMRRSCLLYAKGIAEATDLNVLVEEPPTRYWDVEDAVKVKLINVVDKPSWLGVLMRLAKPGTKSAITRSQVSGSISGERKLC